MSFLYEKDVLKKGSSGGSKTSSSTNQKVGKDGRRAEDVVERAKAERKQRKILREQGIVATRIQSWWRGRCMAHRVILGMRKSVEKKITDIENLSKVLFQKGVRFAPPVAVAIELCQSLLAFGVRGVPDILMLPRLCTAVVIPTLTQTDPSKNLAIALSNADITPCHWANRLFMAILAACTPKTARKAGITQEQICDQLLPTLHLLIGGGGAQDAADCINAFRSIRRTLTKQMSFFRRVRGILTLLADPHIVAGNTEETVNSSTATFCVKRPAPGGAADQLLELSMIVVQADDGQDNRLGEFCSEIFVTPLLTILVSEQALRNLGKWGMLGKCLEYLYRPQLVLPPAMHEVFSSGQWLLGNIASVAPFVAVADASLSGPALLSDETLHSYLSLCASLLQRYDVPGVLRGRNGVVWTRSGASLTAAGVPRALQEQILSLLHPSFSSALCHRILLPLRHDVRVSPITTAEDRAEVTRALTSSGLQIAQAAIQEGQEASTWFTSKWASKMMTSVSRTLGVSSSSSKRSADVTTEDLDSSYNLTGTSEWYTLPESPFAVNSKLVAALANLWAIALPPAGAASVESLAWRLMSSIAFATHASDRLWVASLLLCGDDLKAESSSSNVASNLPTKKEEAKGDRSGGSSSAGLGVTKMFSFLLGGSSSSNSNSDARVSGATRRNDSGVEKYAESTFDPKYDLQPCLYNGKFAVIAALAAVLRMLLAAIDDSELYDDGKPLPLTQVLRIVRVFKVLLYRTIQSDPSILSEPPALSATAKGSLDSTADSIDAFEMTYRYDAVRAVVAVLSDIYLRWARRPFSTPSLWEIEDTDSSSMRRELQQHTPFAVALLRCMPWSINFHRRMQLFRDVVDTERASIQGGTTDDPFSPLQQRSRGVVVRIRRSNILLDGMAAMERVGSSIKDRVVVRYLNNFGEEEAGIDIGGLFKDFLTDLSTRVFDPSYGLFSLTSNNLLYPNPAAPVLYPGPNELEKLYAFLGRVLGKALYENITLQPQFAHFFLAFMHGRYNFMNLVNDLATLDQELYKNLMFLKNYEGDIADLSLTFSVNDDAMGVTKEIELLPGGSRMPVTSKNRHRYINLVAKHYLYDRLKRQARAFFSGLYEVIQPDLLSIFCAPELQVLVSGATSGVSLEDLKRNTRYAGGYSSVDRHMTRFWAVVDELEAEDLRRLVKFVTSCERPPSLGFSALHPPFTVQRVECDDDQRLPTASTCFNILKLPTYSSQSVLKDRLLTSIRSGAGFDLS